jgi:hypothetical protein
MPNVGSDGHCRRKPDAQKKRSERVVKGTCVSACVLVKEGGTPRSCEIPWKMASIGKRERTRRSSPVLAPIAPGSGGVTKYRVLLQALLLSCSSCNATISPSSRFSDSPKIAPAHSGTMNPSRRLRLLRSNRTSRPCEIPTKAQRRRCRWIKRVQFYLSPGPECHERETGSGATQNHSIP